MELVVQPDGSLRCLYDETVDLSALGQVTIRRASYVEPTDQGQWKADLSPVGGLVLGPFALRSEALAAEVDWLRMHWLLGADAPA
jgi:hypothetical protein